MSWLIDTALWTGALIAAVLVLRRPVARTFGPGLAYGLWALPLLRLVLPPIVLPALPVARVAAPAPVPDLIVLPAATAPAPHDWRPLLIGLWLAGALVLLGWRLVSYRRMRARLLAGARTIERRGAVRVVEARGLASPVAFGLIDPVVVMPAGFAPNDPAARDLALAHELAHHRRLDLWANWAAQPLLALHWCNPLAWAGWRAMRRDQEAACDAMVLAGRDGPTRAAYAALIATLAGAGAASPAAALACPMLREPNVIHRLRSLTMTDTSKRRRWLGRALWGAAALTLPLTASISRAQNADVPPPPPAVPAAPTAPAAPEAPAAPTPPIMLSAPAVGEKKVVIVQQDKHHGAGHTVTVQRGGKTYVFTTDKELTPAEIDARVGKIEAEVGALPATPGPDKHAVVIVKHRMAGDDQAMRQVVINGKDIDGEVASAMAEADHEIAGAMAEACGKDKLTMVDAAGAAQTRVKLKLCHDGIRAHVAEALRTARAEIAAQTDMPADIKAKVLKQLDEKIAEQK